MDEADIDGTEVFIMSKKLGLAAAAGAALEGRGAEAAAAATGVADWKSSKSSERANKKNWSGQHVCITDTEADSAYHQD